MKARSALLVVSLIAAGLVMSSSPAQGVFHLMKVTEVFAGQTIQPNTDFVELRMYQAGQQFVGGHVLRFYDSSGNITNCTIPVNATTGANQSHILFATAEAQAAFGTADFTIPPLLSGAGGAVCFGPGVDCVTWGSFGGSVSDDKGAVTNPEGPIPLDQSIHRDLKGNSTLENTDDTNNSNADFAPAPENATANGPTNLGATSCAPGGTGGGGGGGGGSGVRATNIKAKVQDSRAIITGKIQPPAPGDKVTLTLSADGEKVGKKKDALDSQSKFKKAFRVPSGSARCKVTVRYQGDPVGKKKFAC